MSTSAGVPVAETLPATVTLRGVSTTRTVSTAKQVEAAGAGLLLGRFGKSFAGESAGRVISEIAALIVGRGRGLAIASLVAAGALVRPSTITSGGTIESRAVVRTGVLLRSKVARTI
jgi:hypothetical protein